MCRTSRKHDVWHIHYSLIDVSLRPNRWCSCCSHESVRVYHRCAGGCDNSGIGMLVATDASLIRVICRAWCRCAHTYRLWNMSATATMI